MLAKHPRRSFHLPILSSQKRTGLTWGILGIPWDFRQTIRQTQVWGLHITRGVILAVALTI
jgi:hypothetical protein